MTVEMDTIQDGLSEMTTDVAELLGIPGEDARIICLLALAKQVLASSEENVDTRDGSVYVTGVFTREYSSLLKALVDERAGAKRKTKEVMDRLFI